MGTQGVGAAAPQLEWSDLAWQRTTPVYRGQAPQRTIDAGQIYQRVKSDPNNRQLFRELDELSYKELHDFNYYEYQKKLKRRFDDLTNILLREARLPPLGARANARAVRARDAFLRNLLPEVEREFRDYDRKGMDAAAATKAAGRARDACWNSWLHLCGSEQRAYEQASAKEEALWDKKRTPFAYAHYLRAELDLPLSPLLR